VILRDHRFGVWVGLTALMIQYTAGADDKVKPRSFEDQYDFSGGRPEDYNDHATRLSRVVENKRGKSVARNATTYPRYLRQGRRLGSDFLIRYPDLAEGDVAAFFGGIYRVDSLAGRDTNDPWMRIKRLPKDKLPPGLSLAWDSIAVPPCKDERGLVNLHDALVRVTALDPPANKGDKPTAKISVSYRVKGMQDFVVADATVKQGDVVLLYTAGHKVRAVVPPDAKAKVIGWLELDPDPVLEADLIKNEVAFVRPRKREK
jgi:hypothetical protein